MSTAMLVYLFVVMMSWAMVLIIANRCVNILRSMHLGDRNCPLWKFIGFGLSYVALAGSSIGAAIVISQGDYTLSHIGFMVSSTGLILCNRRRDARAAEAKA